MGKGIYAKEDSLYNESTVVAIGSAYNKGLAAVDTRLSFNDSLVIQESGREGLYIQNDKLMFNGTEVSSDNRLNLSIEEFNEIFAKQSYKEVNPYYITDNSQDVLVEADVYNNQGFIGIHTDVYNDVATNIASLGDVCVTGKNIVADSPEYAVIGVWLNRDSYNKAPQDVQINCPTGVSVNYNSLTFGTNDFYIPQEIIVTNSRTNYNVADTKTISIVGLTGSEDIDIFFPSVQYVYKNGWIGGYQMTDVVNTTDRGSDLLMSSDASFNVDFQFDTSRRFAVFIKVTDIRSTSTVLRVTNVTADDTRIRVSSSDNALVSRVCDALGYAVKQVGYMCGTDVGVNSFRFNVINNGGNMIINEIGIAIW